MENSTPFLADVVFGWISIVCGIVSAIVTVLMAAVLIGIMSSFGGTWVRGGVPAANIIPLVVLVVFFGAPIAIGWGMIRSRTWAHWASLIIFGLGALGSFGLTGVVAVYSLLRLTKAVGPPLV